MAHLKGGKLGVFLINISTPSKLPVRMGAGWCKVWTSVSPGNLSEIKFFFLPILQKFDFMPKEIRGPYIEHASQRK